MVNKMSANECADKLCKELNDQNVHVDCLHVDDCYIDSDETRKNIEIWSTAENLDVARSRIKSVSVVIWNKT